MRVIKYIIHDESDEHKIYYSPSIFSIYLYYFQHIFNNIKNMLEKNYFNKRSNSFFVFRKKTKNGQIPFEHC